MYKNRKLNRNSKKTIEIASTQKRQLNTIDENTTMKIKRIEEKENACGSSSVSTKVSIEPQGNLEEMLSSEENIPASQEPTQRYLSQRSNFTATTLCRTQSRTISQRPPNTYFELVMMKAGVQLDEPENFVLSCDHVAFVSKFREIFIKSQNYPENVVTFKTGLRDALNSKSKMKQKLLCGCTISIPGEDSVYQSQDSMIVNFLTIDFLREHVLEVLLEKIEKAACENSPLNNGDNIPILPLMLAQLRYVVLSHGELIYTRLKDIFEKCNDTAKCDIISNAEFVLDSSKHDKFIQMLLDNVPNSKDLFNISTIQTLTNLCLSAKMQTKLRNKIIAFIKDNQCPTRTLPFLVKFLLKALNEDNDDCVHELITALREILIWNTNGKSISNDKQSQLELFNFINQGLTRSKRFYEIWQKTIASLPASQFRSIDFVILLLLIHVKEDRAFYIENILRRRIKLEHITVDILNETKTKFGALLELHTNTLMQILHNFLHEKHKNVADFSRTAYGILFEISDSVQKNILKKLLELTCDKSASNMTTLALELLKDLQHKYTKEVQNWGMLLMPLLDRLNDMTLSQTRLVMKLLCFIAYPAPNLAECPVLQDQIDMLVKKQMINRTSIVKKQGIIGCVQLIDSIARIEETIIEMDDLNTTYDTVSHLPDGRGKIAAQYIARVYSSTVHCAESLALFYDELANVCAASPVDRANGLLYDKPFLIWICEVMTIYFQKRFIVEHSPETTFGIELSYQKCINTVEDTNTEESVLPSIAINIAELVLKPGTDASSSILVLAPLFNIVRVLHLQRHEGSLEQINALLGCAIILPTFFDDPETIIYDFDADVRRKVLDIYFHCVNWIRETVSSFTTQRQEMIRRKVLVRLSDLIQIEDTVRKLLLRAPADYTPPLCQFITAGAQAAGVNTVKTGGRGRPGTHPNQKGNKISNNIRNESNESEALITFNETNVNNIIGGNNCKTVTSNKHNFDGTYGAKEIYRQMDSDIIHILREKLTIQYPLPPGEIGKSIGLLEYRFIMYDLVSKLESVTGVQKFSSEQTLQYIAKPYYFMSDLAKFLNAISRNMEILASAITYNLEKVKYLYGNADLFTDQLNFLKVNFALSLRLLSAYFAWSEFMNAESKASELLKESLLVFFELSKSQQLRSQGNDEIAKELFSKFIKYEANTLDLKAAVYLYQLLLSLRKLSQSNEKNDESTQRQSNEIRNLCKQLLLRKWYNYDGCVEKGALSNIYLDELVKGFLKNSDFRRQQEILRIVLDEIKQLGGKDSAMKSFPNFKKTNFPILFRGLCEVLITTLSDIISSHGGDSNDKLKVWEKSCELLNMLLEIVRALDLPRNFLLFLKYSHLYLKIVLQHGLQIYEQFLRQNPERVSALLRNLQVTTRFLHNLCCHSKALKNTAVVNQIPFLRETVETLLFRVKALLAANKCAGVFCMGNLKNKDLHGDEILSQSATLSAATPDSDEEIPEDDASVDETIIGQNGLSRTDDISDDRVTNNKSKSSSRSKCF